MEQAAVNSPPLMDGDKRSALIQLAQAVTVQAQAMTAQANQEVVTRPHQEVTTMASCLRDFTRMNPLASTGLGSRKTPKNSLMNFYKILLAIGFPTSEKVELFTYQLKDMVQSWFMQWRDNRPLRGGPLTWKIFKKDFS